MAQEPVLSVRDNLPAEEQAIFDAVEQVQIALGNLSAPLESPYRVQIKNGIYQIRTALVAIVTDAWNTKINQQYTTGNE